MLIDHIEKDNSDRTHCRQLAALVLDVDASLLRSDKRNRLDALYDELHDWRPLADIAADIRQIANDAMEPERN